MRKGDEVTETGRGQIDKTSTRMRWGTESKRMSETQKTRQ